MSRIAILLLCCVLHMAGRAAAQVPDVPAPQPDGLPAAARQRVSAEHLFRPGNVAISITAGGAAFSDFQRGWARTEAGKPHFRRRLSSGTTAAVGAEVLWWIQRSFGLRVHGSFMPTRFAVKHDEAGEEWLRRRAGSPQLPVYAPLRVWIGDITAVIRPPLTLGRVAPYGLIGAGVISYRPVSTHTLPAEAASAFAAGPRSTGAAVVGIGAAVPLQRGDLLLTFSITDHIARTPVTGDATEALLDPRSGLSLDPQVAVESVNLTSNVRLMVGLTIPLRAR